MVACPETDVTPKRSPGRPRKDGTPAQRRKPVPVPDADLLALAEDWRKHNVWAPLIDPESPETPTPQRLAYDSKADVLLYGGEPGGAKTDLLLGLALTTHLHSIIFRRQARQLIGLEQRTTAILGSRKGYNGADKIWQLPGTERLLEFGHCQHPGDELGYQGRPHDLIGFDELAHFLKEQFDFLKTWKRTVVESQRVRVVCASNPPTSPEGLWLVAYWAPWLDPDHPDPAKPGELRWFAEIDEDETVEVENGEPFWHKGKRIMPESRTFIPSSVTDNPYLMATGYGDTLDALPARLREQLTTFVRTMEDDPFQIIPSAWVDAAQDRWREIEKPPTKMTTLGVDPAQGGADQFVLAPRYGRYFGAPVCVPGKNVESGNDGISLIMTNVRHGAVVGIDVVGAIGGPLYGRLLESGVPVSGLNGGSPSRARDKNGLLSFSNKRTEWIWAMYEALDPEGDDPIALPPGRQLKADLCAIRRRDSGDSRVVRAETKKEIKKRIGRSPDQGDAVINALVAGDESVENEISMRRGGNIEVESSYDIHGW